jgi:choice-of-anchor C domain-containing protein
MRLIRLAAVLACIAVSTQATTIFSDGFNGTPAPGTYQTFNGGTLGPWTVGGSVDWIGGYWQPAEGTGSVDMAGDYAGSLSTTLSTVAGQTYTLSFYLAGNPDGGDTAKHLNVQVGSLTQQYTFSTVGHNEGSMGWVLETANFVAAGNDILTFTSLEPQSSPYGPALDGVMVSFVPEPASCALMLFGLAGMIALVRRRR